MAYETDNRELNESPARLRVTIKAQKKSFDVFDFDVPCREITMHEGK